MEKKHYPIAIAIAALLAVTTVFLNTLIVPMSPRPASDALVALSAERYMDHVEHLARPEMQGRGNGYPELETAADYIATQFRVWGLRPAGEAGTYFQKFDVTTETELGSGSAFEINGTPLQPDEDFVPVTFSSSADVEGPVVFVGYGMTAPEMHWDDYNGIDATGKIVVAFRHEPQELDENSLFAGREFTTHASFINKAINARQHGARAIVFITDPNNHTPEEDGVGVATRSAETDDIGIPAVHARQEPVLELFARAGRDLTAVQRRIDTDLESVSFDLPDARIRVATDVIRSRVPVRNVIGAVMGSDPVLRNEWVVIGAHYDHLGLGDRSSLAPDRIGEVHHGADDNASGTSGVLELARLATQNRQNLKRSILFMTFAGEELGLLGSAHFTNNPTIPMDNIVAMINMDMIGRIENDRIFVGGVGTSPEFQPWITELNESIGLNLDFSESGYGSSDHTSFTVKRVPVLFFFSGLHADYHKPSDTHEKINADGARKVLSLAYLMTERIANDTSRPEYTAVIEERPLSSTGGGGYGPYFGSIPDFREVAGVLFADVRPDSPAAKAGLTVGDILVEFDGKAISNLYDFTYALQSRKPGDVVSVVVKRAGQDVRVDVTLEARR